MIECWRCRAVVPHVRAIMEHWELDHGGVPEPRYQSDVPLPDYTVETERNCRYCGRAFVVGDWVQTTYCPEHRGDRYYKAIARAFRRARARP